jgi:hypothetical protein
MDCKEASELFMRGHPVSEPKSPRRDTDGKEAKEEAQPKTMSETRDAERETHDQD